MTRLSSAFPEAFSRQAWLLAPASVLSLFLAIVLAGCGSDARQASGDNEAAKVESTTTLPAPVEGETEISLPSDDTVEDYFQALASNSAADVEDALALTAKGSVAYAYATYFAGYLNADIDGGFTNEPDVFTKVDGGFKSCDASGDESSCAVWSDVEGENGKIVNFKIGDTADGNSFDDRISLGDGSTTQAGNLGSVEYVVAFETLSGTVNIIARVKSGIEPISISSYDAKYRSPNGRQSAVSDAGGPTDLLAKSSATVRLAFPGARLGGTLSLSLFSEDFMREEAVQLRTR